MRTTADEKLHSAKEHIKDAIKCLSEIVVDECYGHDEYDESWKREFYDSLKDLISIKKRLQ